MEKSENEKNEWFYNLEVDNLIEEIKKADAKETSCIFQSIFIMGDFNRRIHFDYNVKEKKLTVDFDTTGEEEAKLKNKIKKAFPSITVIWLGMDITDVCKNLDLAHKAKTEEECSDHLKNAHKNLMSNLFKTFGNKK